jgi:hypothetical protein
MTEDLAIFVSLAVLCGLSAVVHVTTVVGLWNRDQRLPAGLSLFFPPLGCFFAIRARMYGRAALFVATLVGYFALRLATRS